MPTLVLEKAKVQELKEYIAAKKDIPGPLMPVMQKAQELFKTSAPFLQSFMEFVHALSAKT